MLFSFLVLFPPHTFDFAYIYEAANPVIEYIFERFGSELNGSVTIAALGLFMYFYYMIAKFIKRVAVWVYHTVSLLKNTVITTVTIKINGSAIKMAMVRSMG